MRLLLDEMYPSFIARELRARGHDVISVHEQPGRGTPDDRLFVFTQAETRAILTENVRDFRPLATKQLGSGGSHPGLVFTTEKRWPRADPGPLIDALDHLLSATPRQPTDTEIWL